MAELLLARLAINQRTISLPLLRNSLKEVSFFCDERVRLVLKTRQILDHRLENEIPILFSLPWFSDFRKAALHVVVNSGFSLIFF